MAQSPITITGLSADGVASAYLGGVYREHLQICLAITPLSSNPTVSVTGSIWANTSQDASVLGSNTLYSVSGPYIGGEYLSSTIGDGFYRYVNIYAAGGLSSAYFSAITATIYFDGQQWPSS